MSPEQRAFAQWFGLRPHEAEKLEQMRQAHGRPVRLYDKPSIAKVIVCRIRASLAAEAIDTAGHGAYYMTEVGMAECETAIRECAA